MSEKLSNLLDKKVDPSELDEFLQHCRDDPSLMDRWQRYHIARALLKDEITETDLSFDVTGKVMAQLESEPAGEAKSNVIPMNTKSSSWPVKKPWLPMALAASLLLGLYFVVQQPTLNGENTELIAENTQGGSINHWQTNDSSIEDILNSLLVEHSEFTSVTGMNGLGSYSKFIAYQN